MGTPLLDWAVAARPLAGQPVSGDLHLVAPFPGGVLLAVVDGLGHGPAAAAAAQVAVEVLAKHAELPVSELLQRCQAALGRLRGVVMSLASLETAAHTLTWVGVGNVEAALLRSLPGGGILRERLLLWGGIVGQSLGSLRPASLRLARADVLVLATDGIDSDFLDVAFLEGVHSGRSAQELADGVLRRHALPKDDALVLVARYEGEPA